MQTSGANSERKHSKIDCFSTLDERVTTFSKLKRLLTLSISSVTCTNQSVDSSVVSTSRLAFNSNGPMTSTSKWNTKTLRNVTNKMCVKTMINIQL